MYTRAIGGAPQTFEVPLDNAGSPPTLAIVHRSGLLGPITVTLEGFLSDVRVVTRTVSVSFVPDEIRVLRMELRRSCVMMDCGDGMVRPTFGNRAPWYHPWYRIYVRTNPANYVGALKS